MTMDEAIQRLYTAVNEVQRQGFVMTGKIELVKPKTVGLVHTVCTGQVSEEGRVGRFVVDIRKPEPTPEQAEAQQQLEDGARNLNNPISAIIANSCLNGLDLVQANRDEERRRLVMEQGYTGNTCPSCYSFRMRRKGTCETCESCGAQSGCS